MDLRFLDSSKEETGVINNEQLHDVSRIDDVYNEHELFKVLIPYNDKNWLKVRNAVYFHDVAVPDIIVRIKMLSIQHDSLLITGIVRHEEAIEWTKS